MYLVFRLLFPPSYSQNLTGLKKNINVQHWYFCSNIFVTMDIINIDIFGIFVYLKKCLNFIADF